MEQWPGGKLHREIDNANYTCISSSNIAGDGVSSNTIFRVECKLEMRYVILSTNLEYNLYIRLFMTACNLSNNIC